MLVLKLGGSVLTDKSQYATLRAKELSRLASEVASVERGLVIVHGAGSFGHMKAREFALAEGRKGTREQDGGFADVHRDVRRLHLAVLDALAAAGVRAVGCAPLDVVELKNGTLHHFDAAPIARALAAGLTPVTFGDAVFDSERGFGIVSGDQLVDSLARGLKAERVVFATDVDGIFDREPIEGRLVALQERLTSDDALAVTAPREGRSPDVTGSMAGKIARIASLAKAGIPVDVVNGLAPGRVAAALSGGKVVGTRVEDAPRAGASA
ncbi:MAG: isopentenyl phosphate kinase [Thermoplasmatota archaeon]